ncbi:hypothetical protein [Ralstonia pseudosolanacearum]|uniref:hypothetical protein n=1 Tax=Ralstonia pseudosolanacearum TaxID=1310165 RepID=UPI00386D8973
MSDDLFFFSSRFWGWCVEHEPIDFQTMQTLREKALTVLIESVNAGEIISLDGIDSPLSMKIKEHHRLIDFEMNTNWIGSAQDWACPCCSRTKFQISRPGQKNQILAKLVVHHDHMGEALEQAFHVAFEEAGTNTEQSDGERLIERIGEAFAAFEEVLVCEDCNNADTSAKKLLGTPKFFSFPIRQIQRFITSKDHQPHQIDATIAREIWEEARPAYELRMSLIRAVAHAAATDSHWYEPYARGMQPIPTLRYENRQGDASIKRWVSTEALYRALGPQPKTASRNLSRWRTTAQKSGRALPENYLAMLLSDEFRANRWDSVDDGWSCPVCQRTKEQVVYVAEKGKIRFHLATNAGRGAWVNAKRICGHCMSTLMSLKLEISELTANTSLDSYGFVSPDELAAIIVPRAHSAHSIRANAASSLVDTIVKRLDQ